MWQEFLTAISLVMVIEGLLPFLSPAGFKKSMRMISEMDNNALRWMGLLSMFGGLALLYIVR